MNHRETSALNDKYRLDNFDLYKAAREFRRRAYQLVRQLPSHERYELVPQLKRAAISVSNNIAEGHGRWKHVEYSRFCRIARGSIEEIIDDCNICLDERYGDQQFVEDLKREAYDLIHRVNGYIAYLRKTKQGHSDS